MKIIKIIIAITIILSSFYSTVAQDFTGTMKLKRITKYDTTNYNYYVKGNKVRIEELNNKGEVEGIMLLNINNKKIVALSPIRKLFFMIENTYKKDTINNLEIIKSNNKKAILGYECKEWIVKDSSTNTIITYWTVPEGFNFFEDFLITLNRRDKIPKYFLQIDNIKGAFPLLYVERTMQNEEIASLEAVEITQEELPSSLFTIPADYVEVKTNR